MKIKIVLIFIALSGYIGVLQAQFLINQGADIVITSGSSLVIDGEFRNELDGSMDNDGEVLISGDWINNASGNLLFGTSGTVTLNGTTTQTLGGSNNTYFNHLNLQNDAVLGILTYLTGNLSMNSNFISIGSNNFWLLPGSSIIGAGPFGYVIANGTGYFIREVGASNTSFPVGTTSSFTPVVLNNSGTVDEFGINVFADVRENGLAGATISEINDCVNNTWNILENSTGGSDLSITTFWYAGIEGASFDRTHCSLGHYTGGSWDGAPEGPALGAGPYSITRTDVTTLSAFAVGDLESPMAIPLDIRLESYAFLEGPFNGFNMGSDIATDALLPLSQPYSGYPWFYAGTENVPAIPFGVVDWILLELRDAVNAASATGATTIARKAAFVLEDGTIVDLDGSSIPIFTETVNNDLFVVVYHRNHLPIMSANPVTHYGGIYSYDFTTAESQVYGGAAGHKLIAAGTWGMFSGNADGDKFIIVADRDNIWDPQSGTYGYLGGDMNMNGQVDNEDKNDHWYENTGEISQVPN